MLYYDFVDILIEYILMFLEMNRILLNIVINVGKVNIDDVLNIYGIFLIVILGIVVIILLVVFLIYKIMKLCMYMI